MLAAVYKQLKMLTKQVGAGPTVKHDRLARFRSGRRKYCASEMRTIRLGSHCWALGLLSNLFLWRVWNSALAYRVPVELEIYDVDALSFTSFYAVSFWYFCCWYSVTPLVCFVCFPQYWLFYKLLRCVFALKLIDVKNVARGSIGISRLIFDIAQYFSKSVYC